MSKWIKKLDEWANNNEVVSSEFCQILDALEKENTELQEKLDKATEALKDLYAITRGSGTFGNVHVVLENVKNILKELGYFDKKK